MRSALLHASSISVILLASSLANNAIAQSSPDLKARCDQLLAFYDRYGVGSSESSDGARNPTRIAAGLDCEKGNYDAGISVMEALIKRKQLDVPPVPAAIAQSPQPLKPHGEKRHTAQ
jgi:hypothetical protein